MENNTKSLEHGVQYTKLKKKYRDSIGAALLYGTCSTSMAFLNKAVISTFSFDFPLYIMSCQMITCIVLMEIFRISGIIHIPKYSLKLGQSFMWPSIFYALHSFTALHALGGMSIPMYAAVKRCAPIITLFLSVILLQKKTTIFSIFCDLDNSGLHFSNYILGAGDLKFDVGAYKYGVISVFAQGFYLTLAQKGLQTMSALDVLYISSYNTVLIFTVFAIYFESPGLIQFIGYSDITFLLCFALQISMGVLLNYSLYLCTEKNSALTTSIIGVLKSILQTVIGIFTFGGIQFNILNTLGLSINLFGSTLYAYVKYAEKKQVHLTQNSDLKV